MLRPRGPPERMIGYNDAFFFFRWYVFLLASTCLINGRPGGTQQTSGLQDADIPGLSSGLLFSSHGPLVLATGEWILVTRFRSRPTQAQAKTIREHFQQIEAAITSLPDLDIKPSRAGGNRSYSLPPGEENYVEREMRRRQTLRTNLAMMWKRERVWMEYELDASELEMNNLSKKLKRSRKTRGLLPFVGDAMKWAFGTSTEKDTKRLHKQIKEVEVGVGKLHHLIDLQTTIIGSLRANQKTEQANLKNLANETQQMFNSLVRIQTSVTDMWITTHVTIRQEIDFSQTVASAIRTAGAAVLAHRQTVHELSQAMAHTQSGKVTPVILPLKALEATLNEIQGKLPEGWTYAQPPYKNTADLYQMLTLNALATREGWEVHISIPLRYRPYGTYQLHKITPIPTHFVNSTTALVTIADAEYFAISSDHRLHFSMGTEDLKGCIEQRDVTYCKEFTPLIKEQRKGCLYDAFRGNTQKTDAACRRRVLRPPPQLYTIARNRWVYVLPEPEIFSLECVGSQTPSKIFKLQGTGVFKLPPGCAAIGDRFIVPAHLCRTGSTQVNGSLDYLTHFEINLSMESLLDRIPEEAKVPQIDLLGLIEKLPADRQLDVTLTTLKEQVKNWKIKDSPGGTWSVTIATNMTFSVLGAMAVVVVIAILCRHRRNQQRRPYVEERRQASPGPEGLEVLRFRMDLLEKELKDLGKKQGELQRLI